MKAQTRSKQAHAVAIGLYAGLVYVFFLLVLSYSVGFFIGFGVPKGIDDGPTVSGPAAVMADLLLLAVFAIQHTVMARPWFKRVWMQIVPAAAERSTFVLAASLVLAAVDWLWCPVGGTVWQLHGWVASPLVVGYLAGWALAIGSTYLIDHADLFGLRPAWARVRRVAYQPPQFAERSLYKHIRHPLMAGFVLVFWCTPFMSAGHLLFAVLATSYTLVGIGFEERDLVRSLGADYLDYRRRVPALIPRFRPSRPAGRDRTV